MSEVLEEGQPVTDFPPGRCIRPDRTGSFAALRVCVCVALVFLSVGLVVSSSASAAFSRHFLRSIACLKAGESAPCAGSGPLAPSGVAVDSENDVWVESAFNSLVGFGPAPENSPLETVPATPPIEGPVRLAQVAIQHESKDFYVTGQSVEKGREIAPVVVYDRFGAKLGEWGTFQGGRIAIDNAPTGSLGDPSACGTPPSLALGECFVYVSSTGEAGGIEKFDSKGTKVPFTASAAYLKANKITGIPGRETGGFGQQGLNAIAVDSQGDIYADNAEAPAVYEYAPTGAFLREFSLLSSEVPRLGERVVTPTAVAFDPVSKHLLVAVVVNGLPLGAIDEFDAKTGKFIAETTEVAPGVALEAPGRIAADSSGNMYVTAGAGELDVYGPGRFLPTVTLGAASQRTGKSVLLAGSVDPEGFPLTECRFQYVSDELFSKEGFAKAAVAECNPSAGAIPAGNQSTSVSAAVSGLTPGVTYRYRLLAHSEGELGGTAETAALAFTAPALPEIVSSSAANVSSTGAELVAQIKPDGAATSYHFEYDSRPYSGEERHGTSIPVPEASIGSGGPTGGATESVTQHAEGLTAGSEYHYRVLATNETGTTYGPDQVFTTVSGSPPSLPDNRAYELVTPASKEGGSDMFAEPQGNGEFSNRVDVGTPALAGDGFEFATFSAFGAFPGAGQSKYVFHRDPVKGGWGFTSLESPSLGVQSIVSGVVFDRFDLSHVAFEDTVGAEAGEQGAHSVDLVGAPGGPYTTLHEDPAHTRTSVGESTTSVAGASRDVSHLVLEGNNHATCGPEAAANKILAGAKVLCEWDGGVETLENGETRPELRLVNLAPGSESEPASLCGARLGYGGDAHNAVSADGAKMFFTAPQTEARDGGPLSGPGCWNPKQEQETGKAVNAPQLYMRAGGKTIEVSKPEEGVSVPAGEDYGAQYVGASEDGARVYFVSKSELTADDAGIHDLELYEYDTETGKLTRVSAGESGHDAAEVVTVYAVAAQGTAVYFTADGVLAGNEGPDGSHASPGGCHHGGTPGPCNLYRYQPATAKSAAKISFVARVHEQDIAHTGSGTGVIPVGDDLRAYATPDGRYLLFDTREDLTGYSTASCGADAEQCMELYRYDAQAAEAGGQAILCVSCNPSGAPPVSNAKFERSIAEDYTPVRAMSDDGEHVFFDSADPLVRQARNGTLDVYEWQASGVGGCVPAGGCVRLLSSPSDPSPSYFLGSSPYYTPAGRKVEDGNVFIGTHAQLVAQDTNPFGDIYDVRICDPESPCIQPAVGETLQCEGGSCQRPPAAPNDATPASLAFSGAGNLPALSPPAHRKTAVELRAEHLRRALKRCRADRSKKKRKGCEASAQKKYGAVKKAKRARHVSNDRRAH
jgi:hypothetical protein